MRMIPNKAYANDLTNKIYDQSQKHKYRWCVQRCSPEMFGMSMIEHLYHNGQWHFYLTNDNSDGYYSTREKARQAARKYNDENGFNE